MPSTAAAGGGRDEPEPEPGPLLCCPRSLPPGRGVATYSLQFIGETHHRAVLALSRQQICSAVFNARVSLESGGKEKKKKKSKKDGKEPRPTITSAFLR